MMEATPLNISCKQLQHIGIGDPRVEFHKGCAVLDITFPNTFHVDVGEIHFKNFYTAILTIKAKVKTDVSEGDAPWKTCVRGLALMPNAHAETGAEDYFTITSKMMIYPLHNIVGIRFILRQPSPVWKDFKIDDIKMFKVSHQVPAEVSMPQWLKKGHETDARLKQIQGLAPVESLSANLQQMWVLAMETSSSQPSTPLGRYEVDDCYEINLLSYT